MRDSVPYAHDSRLIGAALDRPVFQLQHPTLAQCLAFRLFNTEGWALYECSGTTQTAPQNSVCKAGESNSR